MKMPGSWAPNGTHEWSVPPMMLKPNEPWFFGNTTSCGCDVAGAAGGNKYRNIHTHTHNWLISARQCTGGFVCNYLLCYECGSLKLAPGF